MNKRDIGKLYEDKSVSYLENKGYEIIDRNYTKRCGEIDIVAKDKDTICFIEVKYRNENSPYLGAEAVDKNKIKKIISTAKYYVYDKHLDPDDKYRFDVISIDGDNIRLYKGAFE